MHLLGLSVLWNLEHLVNLDLRLVLYLLWVLSHLLDLENLDLR